jgi:hypothetical protein
VRTWTSLVRVSWSLSLGPKKKMATMPAMMAVPMNSGNIYRCGLSLYQTNISGRSSSVRIILLVIARFLCGSGYFAVARRCSV